jgi:Zn-dependent protease with chaperone function
MNAYRAHAFSPETGARVHTGSLRVDSGVLKFESATVQAEFPLHSVAIRCGGHSDEQVFFEDPARPGWSIYSSDPALLMDPVLLGDPRFQKIAQRVDRSRRAIPFPVLAGLVLVLLFCAGLGLIWLQKDRIVDFAADRIPVSWEEKLGEQAFAQVRAQGELLTNSAWQPHVDGIVKRLLPTVEQSGYTFQFHIMADTNVNAFAMPGGYVVILTGLLERAESAEEVAGVLAHELAHVTRRHSLRNIIKSAGLIVTIQALFGDVSGIAAIALEGSRFLMQQKFSRDFEREADDTGWSYLLAADIDPRGMTRFFEKMKQLAQEMGAGAMEGSLSLLSTHPASQERIERLEAKWRDVERKDRFVPLPPWPAAGQLSGRR